MSVRKSESECTASAIIAELLPTMPAINLNANKSALQILPQIVTRYISCSLVIWLFALKACKGTKKNPYMQINYPKNRLRTCICRKKAVPLHRFRTGASYFAVRT